MKLDIKLSCIAQHKEPTLNRMFYEHPHKCHVLFKQDVLRTSAQMSFDIDVADGLYIVAVAARNLR